MTKKPRNIINKNMIIQKRKSGPMKDRRLSRNNESKDYLEDNISMTNSCQSCLEIGENKHFCSSLIKTDIESKFECNCCLKCQNVCVKTET